MARELRSNPKTSCAVIMSRFALHNFLLERQGPGQVSEGLCAPDDGPQERFAGESDAEGESYRRHVLHEWFSDEAEDQETHLGPSECCVNQPAPMSALWTSFRIDWHSSPLHALALPAFLPHREEEERPSSTPNKWLPKVD
ncbi:uncharacterized protein LOC126996847 [Eriocheir sinensis]|uniref:uncharacterized protein LOC126996847 n=1 Tax=Eriocheir sinensis TaxID=95602 RepID=UPI0021C79914|nr:uncharacterized protein LOC126996847 [Eriocheir sinensis]